MKPFASAVFVALILAASAPSAILAQQPVSERSAAEKVFDAALEAVEKTIDAAPSYVVKVESKWKTTGGDADRAGTNTARLTVTAPDKFVIEASFGDAAEAKLTVASDGKSVTRVFRAAKLFSVTPTSDPWHDVSIDGITGPALEIHGIDFLIRPDLSAAVLAQTVSVTELGEKAVNGRTLRCFSVRLASERDVEIRLTTGGNPLPVELVTSHAVPLDEKRTLTHTVETKLDWDLSARPAAAAFAVNVPAGMRKVDDIMEQVFDAATAETLGKPVPAVSFTSFDGKPVKLSESRGKSIAVLFFWATWSAPSTEAMPDLNKFVAEYTGKGVKFLAVNVGESPDYVKAFVAKVGYKGEVVTDPTGAAMAPLRANAVPFTLVVGADGTLRSFHRGGKPGNRELLRKELDTLLAGKDLVPRK